MSRAAPSPLVRFVVASLGVHVAVGVTVWWMRSAEAGPRFEQPPIPVELVRLGKPRDPKLLPRKPQRPAPTPPAPQRPTESPSDAVPVPTPAAKTPKPKSSDPPSKAEPNLSRAAQRLLSADERSLDQALSKIEPPEGVEGGFVDGTTSDPAAMADAYLAQIKAKLQRAYTVPRTISAAQRPFLRAKLLLRIGKNGQVIQWKILERHPNAQFMGALEKLLKQIEFPPPPNRLTSLLRGGVEVEFRPN